MQIQLEGWLDIVSTFDVDQLAGMSVGIFPLQNATVEEVVEELGHIMSGPGGEVCLGLMPWSISCQSID